MAVKPGTGIEASRRRSKTTAAATAANKYNYDASGREHVFPDFDAFEPLRDLDDVSAAAFHASAVERRGADPVAAVEALARP